MKALVTGGGGFLGGRIVRQLVDQGAEVRSFSRETHPGLDQGSVSQIQGDLADFDAVKTAMIDCDTVFHVAAKAGVWGSFDSFYRPNVLGTQNVIRACRELGVQRLIYTSSPSVVFDGTDMEGVDESVPYPEHYHSCYPQTKAEAEKLVLAANSPELATVALRPHLIWGPGDNHLVPRILDRGRKGQLRRIGKRPCLVDTVYIDNAAQAHLCASEKLAYGAPCAGRPYFISNNEPIPVWEMVDRILAADGQGPVSRTIPPWLAYGAGVLLEGIYRAFNITAEPRMTRFVARELSTAHWFNTEAAQKDLGYVPKITLAEGLERLKESLQGSER